MADAPPSEPTPGSLKGKPPPPTPGIVGSTGLSRLRSTRTYRAASGAWRWKGAILTGTALTYAVLSYVPPFPRSECLSELIDRKLVRLYSYVGESSKAKKRDRIPEKTVLYWKIYDGGIVEAKSYGSK